jgi:hypothetical protein
MCTLMTNVYQKLYQKPKVPKKLLMNPQVQTLDTVKTSRIVVHPSQNTAQIPFNWFAACQLLPEQESRLKSSQGITKWHVHHHAIDMLITEDGSVENRRSRLAMCYGF